MCKVPVKLRELVKQRLAAAAEEIFELLERTITEYEEEAERQRRLMETLIQPRGSLPRPENDPFGHSYINESPLSPHIKEELQGESSSQEALHRDIMTSQLWEREDTSSPLEFEEETGVSVKSEEEEAPETWTQPVHHNQTVSCPEPPVPMSAPGEHLLHLNDPEAEETLRGTYSKKYICLFCPKSFVCNGYLQKHMRIHTGEKPFSCSVCGRRFTQKVHMEKHKMIHSGLKPYSCTFCRKTFAQKGTLNCHLLIHTGEKPYRCSVCGKHFRQTSSLKKHTLTHRQNV